jgi:hypothetical protein
MNNAIPKCGDSNHMRTQGPRIEFFVRFDGQQTIAVILEYTAPTVGSVPRILSRAAEWNERLALCI